MRGGCISLAVLVILLVSFVMAQDDAVPVYLFYGEGCPHCAGMEVFLDGMEEEHPGLEVYRYEVWHDNDNRQFLYGMAEAFGSEVGGVPMVFVGNEVFVGYSSSISDKIEDVILFCAKEGCGDPMDKVKGEEVVQVIGESSPSEDVAVTRLKRGLTIPAVIGAAAADAVNPCAFAVLIILVTTILASGAKRRALWAGLAFSLSIFISYFLMGLGLFSAISAAGMTRAFYVAVAMLAIMVGLFNLKDYLWYGKWFVMEVPMSWRPKLKSLIRGVTSVYGAFFIGFVVSIFLLPCTSGPYIAILGLLAETATRDFAVMSLLLYNLVFVLPMVLITLAVYFGLTNAERAEEWRAGKLKVLHLIAGVLILLLGVVMLVGIWLGFV